MIRERRAHARFAVALPIRYRRMGGRGMGGHGDGLVTNISEGGLLVGLASDGRRQGTRLVLALPRTDGGWFELPGVVFRLHEWGFAVRFDALNPAQLSNLRALLEGGTQEARAGTREDSAPPSP